MKALLGAIALLPLAGAAYPQPASRTCDSACQASQMAALSELYLATGGPSWFRPNFVVNGSVVAPTQWLNPYNACYWAAGYLDVGGGFGYTIDYHLEPCDVAGGVAGLLLPYNNMTGTIPGSVWPPLAVSLLRLELASNQLRGTLAAELAQLSSLTLLELANNEFEGPIPASLFSNLTQLGIIRLSSSGINGTIPSLSALQGLKTAQFAGNALTGSLPRDWLSTATLRSFDASFNQLTGTIPPPLAATDLFGAAGVEIFIGLSDNRLTGTIPGDLILVPLAVLRVQNNLLQGSANSAIGYEYAREISVANNNFSGAFVTYETSVIAITTEILDLRGCPVEGTMPGIRNAFATSYLLSNTTLSGPLPSVMDVPQLVNFQIGDTLMEQWSQPKLRNERGENLPPWLKFANGTTPGQTEAQDVSSLMCLPVVAASPTVASLNLVGIDSYYFGYSNCTCMAGLALSWDGTNATRAVCIPKAAPVQYALILPVVLCTALALLLLGGLGWLWVKLNRERLIKASGPPGQGQPLTMVFTDVESSTELWEWNNGAMMKALDLHDRIIRASLHQYWGYEVYTEGDAFLLAFHSPVDALAWCIATQQALFSADWDPELEQHHATAIRLRPTLGGPSGLTGRSGSGMPGNEFPSLSEVNQRDILFRGLNVRMSLATGVCEDVKLNKTSKRMEYSGQVPALCKALADAPHGGQILLEEGTMSGIKLRLPELSARLAASPGLHEVGVLAGECPRTLQRPASRTAPGSSQGHRSLEMMRLESITDKGRGSLGTLDGSLRKEVLIGTAPSTGFSPADSLSLSGTRDGLLGKDAERGRAGSSDLDNRPARRQTLLGRLGRRVLGKVYPTSAKKDAAPVTGVTLVDLGEHMLPNLMGSYILLQVLVPGLEDRAWVLPPLRTIQTRAGFFEAPGSQACLFSMAKTALMPMITLVFCAVEGLQACQAASEAATELLLTHYRDCIRGCLTASGGYECQESTGDFMLSFADPVAAILFCLKVQSDLMAVLWSREELNLPGCQAQLEDSRLLWYGPRVKMGVYQGVPTRICPHATSGRQDIFGTLVNRAARQCHSVAHGGQIMVALDAAQDFIAHWTSLEHVPLDEEGAASARYLTAGPAGDRAPETQAINNLLYSPHATLQQHAEQARAIARSISRAPGTAGQAQRPAPAPDALSRLQQSSTETSELRRRVTHLASMPHQPAGLAQSDPADTDDRGVPLINPALLQGRQTSEVRTLQHTHSSGGSRQILQHPVAEGAQTVHISHCGAWRLKGVQDPLDAILFMPAQLAGRTFPRNVASSKAKQVLPPRGLQVVLELPSQAALPVQPDRRSTLVDATIVMSPSLSAAQTAQLAPQRASIPGEDYSWGGGL